MILNIEYKDRLLNVIEFFIHNESHDIRNNDIGQMPAKFHSYILIVRVRRWL